MKDITHLMKDTTHRLLLCFCLLLLCLATRAQEVSFNTSRVLDNLSNKDVQSLYQDRDGYLWICTRNGLFQYDGYSIITYKSNLYRPDLLTSNNIFCVAEDTKHRLWIGTYSGLNVLDKQTGIIRKIEKPEMKTNGISRILVTRTGRIWFATDTGVYEYLEETDSFRAYSPLNTGNVLPRVAVKTLMEDKRGDIWMGTWSDGLFRYEQRTGKFFKYPKMNERNSAHIVFQDSRENIWVGTWRSGLALLKDAYQPEKTTWVSFHHDGGNARSISDDIIYALAEDANTHALWVGTRRGLSILPRQKEYTSADAFDNYFPVDTEHSISSDEVTSLLCDRQGLMWTGMIGGGVHTVNTRKPDFEWDNLSEVKRLLKTSSVRCLLPDDEDNLWMGLGTYGLGVKDRKTGKFTFYTDMPEFAAYPKMPTVMSIEQYSPTGEIWFSSYNDGVFVLNRHAPMPQRVKLYVPENAAWLSNRAVYHIYEDSRHNLWFASRGGISMRKADGGAARFDSLQVEGTMLGNVTVVQVAEGADGEMWGATEKHGVIRLKKRGGSYTLSVYSVANGKMNSAYANNVYKDAQGRIWAGTGGSGLSLYDERTDAFLPVHARWNLPGDAVVSIREDKAGNLWLGTNAGLVKLSVTGDLENATFRLYTTVDGLQDNLFNRASSAVAPDGEMFFGGHRGYNSFYPDRQKDLRVSFPAMVTDIKVFNQSWSSIPDEERKAVSALSPGFTDGIRLDYRHNNFTIEFSALEYANPERNRYAYKLQGFDAGWQYTDASKRFAYYNNLKAGTYTFYLKSSNSNGIWNEDTLKMRVVILPPPWRTWWAYTLYVLLALVLACYAYIVVRNRIRLRNALHLRELEKAKAEEVNHAKLQFFTNITHELLTPLTILSASVDELRQTAPDYKDQYRVMTNNINRLIRLLQQILEFRKAETGNLKLRVSAGDLALFVRRSLDSFRPLMKKKDIQFSVSCRPEPFNAYFDPDKLDKILYNLLSNASKYNRPGGMVSVELTANEEAFAVLVVKDNGSGIPKEAQKDLFKRFYEGDYRKFKTIGTGIGLSLVRDLVVLHHGAITVESEEGTGTAFTITLPVAPSAYAEEEIEQDTDTCLKDADVCPKNADPDREEADDDLPSPPSSSEPRASLLLVEDNEELLFLMVKLLSTDYTVHTATNGKEAVGLLEAENIDLIVSDVMMPRMDGIELCRYVKTNFDTSHNPIILLTAKNKEEDRVEAYDSGADGFIGKPFSLSVLHARISNLLRTRRRAMTDFKKQLVFEAKELDYTSIDEDFLQRAIDCVNLHLDDADFDQTRFLEEMHTTKSTCFRKLKSLTGLTYVSFIRNIRMKAACRMMEEKRHVRISELAYAVGYNDPRYFSGSFRKEFGMLPSEYMEKVSPGGTVEEE